MATPLHFLLPMRCPVCTSCHSALHRSASVAICLSLLGLASPATALALPGDERPLGTQTIAIAEASDPQSLNRAVQDLNGLLRSYQPTGKGDTSVSGKKVSPSGNGRTQPRLTFVATYDAPGPYNPQFRVSADVSVREIQCPLPFVRSGHVINLDLAPADQDIRNQARNVIIEICSKQTPNKGLMLQVRGTLIEGEDFGRFAGPMAVSILKAQITPFLHAIQDRTLLWEVAKDCPEHIRGLEALLPPVRSCENGVPK